MSTLKKLARNPWPTVIIAYFVLFISFIVVFVTFASRQNVELVQKDYYAEEILFQKQIDRHARAAQLGDPVLLMYDQRAEVVKIQMPRKQPGSDLKGQITFYRPADSRLDREFKLNVSKDGVQQIGVSSFLKGLWKVHINWTAEGADYAHDEALVLGM